MYISNLYNILIENNKLNNISPSLKKNNEID